MRSFFQNEPLTEAELDRLAGFLKSCKGGQTMNIEEVDGFFAALVAGPDMVMPSEFLREVFGGELSDVHEFSSPEEANEILALMLLHWNDISATLSKDGVYLPILLEDENGVAHGNDWARGFMRGVHMRHDDWAGLIASEDHRGCMIPMLILYREHDQDPAKRPGAIGAQQREKIIQYMAAGLLGAYRYFRQHGQPYVSSHTPEPRRNNGKIGRNDPCPCGSGKKYKRCCAGGSIH